MNRALRNADRVLSDQHEGIIASDVDGVQLAANIEGRLQLAGGNIVTLNKSIRRADVKALPRKIEDKVSSCFYRNESALGVERVRYGKDRE